MGCFNFDIQMNDVGCKNGWRILYCGLRIGEKSA